MTGWQGNDGGQGGWNQPYGPDPHATNPYTQQYGTGGDSYDYGPGTGGFAQQDPYGQEQYYTGGFPAQGYGPPPPPPQRSKLPMILSLVAIVIIVGAVVAIVLVNREDGQPVATPDPTTTTTTTSKESTSEESTSKESKAPTTSGGGGGNDGWLTIDNTADAGLTYQVPPDWEKASDSIDSGLDVSFTGTAHFGAYECEGGGYIRTFAASGDVQGKDGDDLDPAATIKDFATSFGTTYYGGDAAVEVPEPTPVKVGDKDALTLTAKVTQNVTKPNCQATQGEVAIVAVPLEAEGEPTGVAMLVVVNDLAGGPATPAPLAAQVSQDILKTVQAP